MGKAKGASILDTHVVRTIPENVQKALREPERKMLSLVKSRKLQRGLKNELEPASLKKEQGHFEQRITNGF